MSTKEQVHPKSCKGLWDLEVVKTWPDPKGEGARGSLWVS